MHGYEMRKGSDIVFGHHDSGQSFALKQGRSAAKNPLAIGSLVIGARETDGLRSLEAGRQAGNGRNPKCTSLACNRQFETTISLDALAALIRPGFRRSSTLPYSPLLRSDGISQVCPSSLLTTRRRSTSTARRQLPTHECAAPRRSPVPSLQSPLVDTFSHRRNHFFSSRGTTIIHSFIHSVCWRAASASDSPPKRRICHSTSCLRVLGTWCFLHAVIRKSPNLVAPTIDAHRPSKPLAAHQLVQYV
ncbi:hypothetical protein BCR44DRAFT_1185391 [Catenaria anguillulae PL171]|uniref:Uncharacterized protein n=1 Tax=Catenaria anguillulae PL171 TaxID=765915 RepID=A0A1Y2HJ40_9FUNG|nr:hypothetical protein BCR44DRAFT_1185391 [Catenaria anguillulae PL171]